MAGMSLFIQFAVSVILIIGTMVIFKQLSFLQNKKLGYDKEGVVIINSAYTLGNNLQPFKTTLKDQPDVINATIGSFLPIRDAGRSDRPYFKGTALDIENSISMQDWGVDFDYIQTMGMKVIEGRSFDPARSRG